MTTKNAARRSTAKARLEQMLARLRDAVDAGECHPTPDEIRALRTVCRRAGVRTPFVVQPARRV